LKKGRRDEEELKMKGRRDEEKESANLISIHSMLFCLLKALPSGYRKTPDEM